MLKNMIARITVLAVAVLAIPAVAAATVPDAVQVPEPSILALLAAGALGVAGLHRARRSR